MSINLSDKQSLEMFPIKMDQIQIKSNIFTKTVGNNVHSSDWHQHSEVEVEQIPHMVCSCFY